MTLEETSRPFRFGLVTTGGTEESKTAWTSYARHVEDLGFDVLQVADHFHNSTVCTPRLAAAAAVTSTLRVGSYVYDNDFRHPVLLAREAAEIDRLSGGRMELGIGAGWSRSEYEMVGIPFDEGAVRASRYEEAVEIVRRLHQGETLDWVGGHYRLNGCGLVVEPVQRPIPLLLGGGGPRMTRLAARWADTVAFVPKSLPGGGLDPAEFSQRAFDHKISVLEVALQERSSEPPERAALVFGIHGSSDEVPLEDWTSREVASTSPYYLIGDTARVVDELLTRRDRWGISHWTFWEEDIDAAAAIIEQLRGQ
jgi:probable F420-dependent oxidoreductase